MEAEERVRPQIFTVNPLTGLMKRMAKIFRVRPGKRNSVAPSSLLANAANASGPQIFEDTDYDPFSWTNDSSAAAAAAPDGQNTTFPPADYSPEEWFLVRQQSPETSQSGMHEVSVKENAYDRYVKQERVARFTPSARTASKGEEAGTTHNRLFAPLKNLFHFGTQATVSSGPLQSTSSDPAPSQPAKAARTTTPGGMDRNRAKQPKNLPRAQEADLSFTARDSAEAARSSRGSLADLIDPTATIREAANSVAQSVPQDASAAQNKQVQVKVFEEKKKEFTDLVEGRLRERLVRLAQGAEAQDQMPFVAKCDITKGLINHHEDRCSPPEPEDLAQLREKNKAAFLAKTHIPLPSAQVIPVLGIADPNSAPLLEPDEFDFMSDTAIPKELYQFIYNNKKGECESGPCYWVANSIQPDDGMKLAFEAAGLGFAGDLSGQEVKIKKDFIEYKKASSPDGAALDEEKLTQQVHQATLPYLLYTQEDMARVKGQQSQAAGEEKTTFYFASAEDAKLFADKYGYDTPFFYGKGHLVLTGDSSTLEQRSGELTNQLADQVVFTQGILQEVTQNAGKEALENTLKPAIQTMQKQLVQEQKEILQNNTADKIQKNPFL